MATNPTNVKVKFSQTASTLGNIIQAGSFYAAIVTPFPILGLLMFSETQTGMAAVMGLMVFQLIALRVGHGYGQ